MTRCAYQGSSWKPQGYLCVHEALRALIHAATDDHDLDLAVG